MASVSPQIDDTDEEQFQALVRVAIEEVVTQLLHSRNQPPGQEASLQSNFHQIVYKIHEILTKLDQLSHELKRCIENSSLRSSLLSYMSPVNPTEILGEIEGYKSTFELFLHNLSRLHTSSNGMYLALVQMAIEGIEIPTIESFHLPPISMSSLLLSSAANAFKSTIQETNVTREMAKSLILRIAQNFTLISLIEQPLAIAADFILQFPISIFMASLKLTEHELSICDNIATLNQKLDASGIQHIISRVDKYLSLMKKDQLSSNIELTIKIWDSYQMIKASVNSCKEQNPDASVMEIIHEMCTQPHCAGLVQPIVSCLHCSVEEAWDIILRVFSKLHTSSV